MLHQATTIALAAASQFNPDDAVRYHVYMDGSASSDGAAWAVVVLAQQSSGLAFIGSFTGPVVVDQEDPRYIGNVSLDNCQAELAALLWAIAWALQASPRLPAVF